VARQEPGRIRGIAQPLPPGEELLWEGRPELHSLAREAFHVRKLALYFGILALLPLYLAWAGRSPVTVPPAAQVVWLLVLGGLLVGLAYLLAWLAVRSSVYAITNRRVVMKVGIGLPAVVNLPLAKVGGAWQRLHRDGTGDLALSLRETQAIGYLLLWPHARPWRVGKPEPMLRSLPDVTVAGEVLREAIAAAGVVGLPEGAPTPVHYDLTGEGDDPTGGEDPFRERRGTPAALDGLPAPS